MEDTGSRGRRIGSEAPDESPGDALDRRPFRFERRRPDPIRFALHDRLGPALANLELRLGLLEESAGLQGFSQEQIASLRREVAGLVDELARIVHDQLPRPLELGGLINAIREACRKAERPGLLIDFTVSGTPILLPREGAELLYRAALEGTSNVARHARARRCIVRLTYTNRTVSLEVRDNGRGAGAEAATSTGGIGLTSLWRAARRLGGSVRLESLRLGGARLVVKLPLDRMARLEELQRSNTSERVRTPG